MSAAQPPAGRVVPPVTLGRSGVMSSKIGLGTGNWIGRQDDEVSFDILREALRLGVRRGVSLPSAALSYSLACPSVHVSVIGPASVAELREDVAAVTSPVSEADLAAIASTREYPTPWQAEHGPRASELASAPNSALNR